MLRGMLAPPLYVIFCVLADYGRVCHACRLLSSTGKFDEAETLFREALGINERAHGNRHPEVASCLNSLAALLQVHQAYRGFIFMLQ